MELDDLDAAILRVLLLDARLSLRAVAREVGSTPTTVGERLKRMDALGLVTGASLALDPRLVPGESRLARGQVARETRDALLAAAREVQGVTGAVVTEGGRFLAVLTVQDLDEERDVLAALRAAGAQDLSVEGVVRVQGPPPVHLFARAVAVREACAQCGRETTDPLSESVGGRRVPFCCTSCRALFLERHAELARRATQGT